jgi:tetratricopeptide (TPR) repeat protein
LVKYREDSRLRLMARVVKTQPPRTSAATARIGERVRQLRVAANMTQTELASDRFSKEYISQIERGKTRPTAETVEWLALRLGADPAFLANGVTADQQGRVETGLTRAEALTQAAEYADAAVAYEGLRTATLATGLTSLEVRHMKGHGRALMLGGRVREALESLNRARSLVESPDFSDVERAEVLTQLAICRYKLSSISTAISLFDEALALADGSGLPCDYVRTEIHSWRSRCYRRQRDYEAAREDVERALELAEGLGDRRALANAYFMASVAADRDGHWVLARTYAERAKAQYEELADQKNVGRLLNNLGGLNFLLGKPDEAKRYLKDAFAAALEAGSEPDAAQAVSSLAQVNLRTGEPRVAEEQARHALQLLDGRVDFLDEIGNAQLVLGRALLEQGRIDEAEELFNAAEASFDQLSSASHRAAAWVAQGDVAAKRGDDRTAARLYRTAAETLQDIRF